MPTSLISKKPHHGNYIFFWWSVWCVIGMSIPVSLNLLGISLSWADGLKQWLTAPPFSMMERAFAPSPLSLFCFGVGSTMFFTWSVMHLHSTLQRVLTILSGSVSLLLFIPICALWQVFFNTTGTVLSLVVAGLGATVTCLLRDRYHGQPSAPEKDEPA